MVPGISVAELAALDDPFILDVREDYEYEDAHLAGVLHVPMGFLGQRVEDLPRDRVVYVICRVGNRSGRVVDALNHHGFQTVNVEGGIEAWEAQGFPIETGPALE